ncbi:MAG: DUF1552 domain-containing protein [Myxococcota bacterium]
MKKRWEVSRRAFLGGAGAAIALPYLEAMVPSVQRAKAAGDDPCRLIFVYVPNGIIRTRMTPSAEGAGYAMTPLLRPIEDVRDDFMVLTGLSNLPGSGRYTYRGAAASRAGVSDGFESNDGPGDHARDTGTYLSAWRLKKTNGTDIENNISVDQVAANHLRMFTPAIPSLVLAARTGSYGGDSGYAPIYKANISWTGPQTPADKEASPRGAFERLFRGFDNAETEVERARRIAREGSILDSVMGDIESLRGRLGVNDGRKLDEYLSGIRQLEVRLETSEGAAICDPGMGPTDADAFGELNDQMFQVMSLAFQCDRTRVVSYLMQHASSFNFLSVGGSMIQGGHHSISHLDSGNSDVEKIDAINEWHIGQFGNLLRQLKSATQGDGTNLLDSTLVMFGGGLDATGHRSGDPLGDLSPQQSGPVHRHTNLPILLGGHGGGVRSGRHVVFNDRRPLADLYVSMLQSVGVETNEFGLEGTGPIGELL